MKEKRPGRTAWFKFWGHRYLVGGSLRAETSPDERAVWLDFLCLANEGAGRFDCASRNALAVQLLIPKELLDRATKKFIEAGRLKTFYDKKEKKEIFIIVKWSVYQAPPRVHRKTDPAENEPPVSLPHTPSLREEERRGKESKREKRREEGAPRGSFSEASFSEKGSKTAASLSPSLSPNEIKNEITNEETIKKEFQDLWENYPGDKGDKNQAFEAYGKIRQKHGLEKIEKAYSGYMAYLKTKRLKENFDQAPMFLSNFLRDETWKRFLNEKYTPRL